MEKWMKRLAVVLLASLLAMPAVGFAADAKQGGEMTVTFKDDVATLDPAIGYDWQNWSMIKSLYDGLMDYAPGTYNLQPGLAESYEVAPDGLAYTFNLRDGVAFHNGRAMTAADVKYSLERTINPKTQSPGQGFFSSIKGFDAVASGEKTDLEGVIAVDPKTVRIELSNPDATFLHLMALNFSFVVPKEAVEEYGADFGKHPVGTGAYKLAAWNLGQNLIFERNKDYYRSGVSKLDKITFEIGQEPTVALLRLQRGEVDVLGDGVPPARYIKMKGDPQYKDNFMEGPQLQTSYITMNVKMKPFDNVKVRQAVNMAVFKERICKIINNRAVPADQPLPPAMPGYAEDYEGYSLDRAKAKTLLAEAGYPDGFTTELYAISTDPNPRIAQAIQQDLSAVGIKANLKTLAASTVIAAGGEPDQAPMLWSGGLAWLADFPDPSNFYGPILGCGGAVKGGWNWAWYCNEAIDAKAQKADAMSDPALSDQRIDLWRDIFIQIMEDAPWVPVFNELRNTMRSDRIGGPEAFFVDPVFRPCNYRYVFAKDAQ